MPCSSLPAGLHIHFWSYSPALLGARLQEDCTQLDEPGACSVLDHELATAVYTNTDLALAAQCGKKPAQYGLPPQLRPGPDLDHLLKQKLIHGTIKHLVDHKLVRSTLCWCSEQSSLARYVLATG